MRSMSNNLPYCVAAAGAETRRGAKSGEAGAKAGEEGDAGAVGDERMRAGDAGAVGEAGADSASTTGDDKGVGVEGEYLRMRFNNGAQGREAGSAAGDDMAGAGTGKFGKPKKNCGGGDLISRDLIWAQNTKKTPDFGKKLGDARLSVH